MTRSINSLVLTELGNEELRPFYLWWINISSTDYYWTDCDVPILHDSNLYQPKSFRVDPIKYSDASIVDKARVTVKNIDEVFTALLVGSSVQGSESEIKFVCLDSNYAIVNDAEILFDGELDEWDLDEEQAKLTFTNIFYQWAKKTINRHTPSCRWRVFKNTQCKYAGGETWCDRSYTRCDALSNTANFGGFRWLPDMETKEIWWGETQKV
jgi:hypothetical protein